MTPSTIRAADLSPGMEVSWPSQAYESRWVILAVVWVGEFVECMIADVGRTIGPVRWSVLPESLLTHWNWNVPPALSEATAGLLEVLRDLVSP